MFYIFGEIFNIRLKIGLIFDNIILDICLLPAIFILALTIHYVYSFTYWKRKNILFIPPKFPFGSVPMLMAQEKPNFDETFVDIYKSTLMMREKLMGFFIFTKPLLLIADPDIIKNILVKDFDKFQTRGLYYNEDSADPLIGHLVNFHGGKLKKIRSKLIFTPENMKKMFGILLQCSIEIERVMADATETHESIGIHDILDRFTIDNISSSVFGLNCNSTKPTDLEFRKYGQMFFNTVKFLAAIGFPKLFNILKHPLHNSKVSRYFINIFKETAEYQDRIKLKRSDFIDLFIKLKNNENFDDIIEDCTKNLDEEKCRFNELTAQAFVFFATGYETSSNAINHCLFELAINANIQDKLRDEIKNTLKKHHGQLTYDGIMEMKYLKKVVDETLRKYPPFPVIKRECNETYSVPNTNLVIERGIQVWISTLGIHQNPDIYPEPNKFDPERFSQEAISSRHPFTYLPFGNGPRNCIGMRFGYLQIKIGIIALLKNYKYGLDPKTKIPSNTKGILLIPKDKIWLRVEKLC